MSLIRLRAVSIGFGGPPLLERLNFQIDAHERVCLIGRNGVGKSTLLKVIGEELVPDEGFIERQQGLVTARLMQEVSPAQTGSIFSVVAGGLGHIGDLLQAYHELSHKLVSSSKDTQLQQLARIQHELEACGGWNYTQRVETILSQLQLNPDLDYETLSGGAKRRVLIARELVKQPDLLLLDEPTNHLDIEAITWLEEFLLNFKGAMLFITHDRVFLRRLATRIVDIDRGVLTSYPGDYATYLKRKQDELAAEATHQAEFDKQLRNEEAWIRQGIKARRTRNQGRVRALARMREQRRARRARMGDVKLVSNRDEESGKLVMAAEHVCYQYRGNFYLKNFSTTILRGDKVGIIGANGCGKTTLLQLLLGELRPQQGTINHGARLKVAYFDQHRGQLQPQQSVRDNVGDGGDKLIINGKSRHMLSYLRDFLFTPERAQTPVKALSGGERNRLLLAKLFAKPFNVLVMDEPTNDLDTETLELLEELLINFEGTLLLVSHDRAFLNNVVTSTLVFESQGQVNEYVGGYDDWVRQRVAPTPKRDDKRIGATVSQRPSRSRKVGYKEQRELAALPQLIEDLEARQQRLQATMNSAEFYKQDRDEIVAAQQEFERLERELMQAYQRWEALETLSSFS